MNDTIPPQVVDRGDNVSPYRARKPPEAIRVHLCGYDDGILVLRCHDLDVASIVAFSAFLEDESNRRDRAFLPFTTGQPGVPIWVRFVFDEGGFPDGPGSWERELRGTIGAVPAVLFATPDTREGIT